MSESPAGLCESGNLRLGGELCWGHGYRCAYPELCHTCCVQGWDVLDGGKGLQKESFGNEELKPYTTTGLPAV